MRENYFKDFQHNLEQTATFWKKTHFRQTHQIEMDINLLSNYATCLPSVPKTQTVGVIEPWSDPDPGKTLGTKFSLFRFIKKCMLCNHAKRHNSKPSISMRFMFTRSATCTCFWVSVSSLVLHSFLEPHCPSVMMGAEGGRDEWSEGDG